MPTVSFAEHEALKFKFLYLEAENMTIRTKMQLWEPVLVNERFQKFMKTRLVA